MTWYPDNIRDGRMGNFVENVIDWGLSRERFWGTPLPVWVCQCGHIHVIGSRAELEELGKDVPHDLELHRPYIDRITIPCPACGGCMHRTPEVIDCWYDSGAMPFAQWHYPFENAEIFEENFPPISSAKLSTRRGRSSTPDGHRHRFRSRPLRSAVMGHVKMPRAKMSKHLGNVVDPWSVLDDQGADAVRWYFYASAAPWLPTRFSGELVSEMQRKFMGTLWNTYAFFTLYASIDGYDPALKADPKDFSLMDRWALSKLNELVRFVDEGLSQYKITETARAIQAFVDELSNWYVRRCRERFWGKGLEGDKLAAFETLYTVLVTLCKLLAPYTPFMTEVMYRNLVAEQDPSAPCSVHLCDSQGGGGPDRRRADEGYGTVIQIVSGRAAVRNTAGISVRQPAQALLYVKGEALPGKPGRPD